MKKENPKKNLKKKNQASSKVKEQKEAPPKEAKAPEKPPALETPPKEGEKPNLYEQRLEQTTKQIASLATVIQGITESYNKQFEEINAKMSALGEAVGTLNNEFTGFVNTLKALNPASAKNPVDPPLIEKAPDTAKQPPGPVDRNAPPPGSASEPAPLASIGDKALGWASLLAQLASGQGGAPASGTEEGLAKGFQMMMTVMQGMGTVMATLRKGFVEEIKTSVDMVKMIKEGGGTGKPENHLE